MSSFIDIFAPWTFSMPDPIGTYHHLFCVECFHFGHQTSIGAEKCPYARIRALLSGEGHFYFNFLDMEESRMLVLNDVYELSTAVKWAIGQYNDGNADRLGLAPFLIRRTANLARDFFVELKENKKLSFFGVENPDSLEFVELTMEGLVNFGQSESRPDPKLLRAFEIHVNENSPEDRQVISDAGCSEKVAETAVRRSKEKGQCVADRLQLPVVGTRRYNICSICYHRGHSEGENNICPFYLVKNQNEKAKHTTGGIKNMKNVDEHVKNLKRVLEVLDPADAEEKYGEILAAVCEWEELYDMHETQTSTHGGFYSPPAQNYEHTKISSTDVPDVPMGYHQANSLSPHTEITTNNIPSNYPEVIKSQQDNAETHSNKRKRVNLSTTATTEYITPSLANLHYMEISVTSYRAPDSSYSPPSYAGKKIGSGSRHLKRKSSSD
ncbi:hypothetical protein RUND412_006685 [Rhizina undulata]